MVTEQLNNGDTVRIPAGSIPWSATNVLTVNKDISIIGAGYR